MESVEIHGPTEVYLGDNITLECITGESFPGEHTLQCCQFAQPHPHGRAFSLNSPASLKLCPPK